MASRARVEEYRRLNADLVSLAQRDLERFWARLDKSDVAAAREALVPFVQALTATYGRPAALIAARFYDDLRSESANAAGTFRAIMAPGPEEAAIEGTVRWAVGPLTGDSPDDFAALERLTGAAQRYITNQGRDTIALSSSRDPSAGGWARVPGFSRSGTCGFCNILASRGPVYGTEASAEYRKDGEKYHDNCTCVPTQIWDGDDLPEGYDPDELYEEYRAGVTEQTRSAQEKIASPESTPKQAKAAKQDLDAIKRRTAEIKAETERLRIEREVLRTANLEAGARLSRP